MRFGRSIPATLPAAIPVGRLAVNVSLYFPEDGRIRDHCGYKGNISGEAILQESEMEPPMEPPRSEENCVAGIVSQEIEFA